MATLERPAWANHHEQNWKKRWKKYLEKMYQGKEVVLGRGEEGN